MVSRSSLMAAAIVSTPTGPPPNFSMRARSSLRSKSSRPSASTSSIARAAEATSRLMWPSALTWAKSRTRFNRLLKRVRDFAQVKADGHISREVASAALAMLEVDALGLDDFDRKLLRALIEKFGGGPVGVETIAAAISEERDTIEDVYE